MSGINHNLKQELIKEFQSVYTLLYQKYYIIEHKDFSEECTGKDAYTLTWCGRKPESNITFDIGLDIVQVMDVLLSEEQFSMLFYDKSILQVEYTIESNMIVKQRMQFIKKCNIIRTFAEIIELENEESEIEGSSWFEDETGIPVFLRADYDPINYEELYHSKSHLVVSNLKDCRIPMKKNITLSKFVELILHQVYNDYGIKFNEHIIHNEDISKLEQESIHISL